MDNVELSTPSPCKAAFRMLEITSGPGIVSRNLIDTQEAVLIFKIRAAFR
jgi:hypothetical protein